MRRSVAATAALLLAGCSPVPLPRRAVYHPSDATLSVTRIAHGTAVIELAGTRVLLDPWFHSGLFVRHREPLGLTPDALPSLAAVLLTHEHAGHFDARALAELAGRVPEAIARPELAPRLRALGFARVTPLGWWETASVGGLEVTAVPARHAVAENGYVLTADAKRVYVSGDTRYFPELVDVATRFPAPDVALLWVGGTRVLGLERAMGPEDAARVAALLEAHRVIPVGYGEAGSGPLRWHARDPVARFAAACRARGVDPSRIVVLEPGESWHWAP